MKRSEFRLTKEQAELLLSLGGERAVVGECKANILCIKRARPLWLSVTKIGDVTLAKATGGGRRAAQTAVRRFEEEELLRQPLSEAAEARFDSEWEVQTVETLKRDLFEKQQFVEKYQKENYELRGEVIKLRQENFQLKHPRDEKPEVWWEIHWDYNGFYPSPFEFRRAFFPAGDSYEEALRKLAHRHVLEDGLERFAWVKRLPEPPHESRLFRFRYIDGKFTCSEVEAPVQPYVQELCAGGAS